MLSSILDTDTGDLEGDAGRLGARLMLMRNLKDVILFNKLIEQKLMLTTLCTETNNDAICWIHSVIMKIMIIQCFQTNLSKVNHFLLQPTMSWTISFWKKIKPWSHKTLKQQWQNPLCSQCIFYLFFGVLEEFFHIFLLSTEVSLCCGSHWPLR